MFSTMSQPDYQWGKELPALSIRNQTRLHHSQPGYGGSYHGLAKRKTGLAESTLYWPSRTILSHLSVNPPVRDMVHFATGNGEPSVDGQRPTPHTRHASDTQSSKCHNAVWNSAHFKFWLPTFMLTGWTGELMRYSRQMKFMKYQNLSKPIYYSSWNFLNNVWQHETVDLRYLLHTWNHRHLRNWYKNKIGRTINKTRH